MAASGLVSWETVLMVSFLFLSLACALCRFVKSLAMKGNVMLNFALNLLALVNLHYKLVIINGDVEQKLLAYCNAFSLLIITFLPERSNLHQRVLRQVLAVKPSRPYTGLVEIRQTSLYQTTV